MDLANRTAVITGASRGLGAGLAADFLQRGMRLALCSRGKPALQPGDAVLAQRVDVTDAVAMNAFCAAAEERFGTIDLWINNAGVLDPIGPLRDITTDQWRGHFDVNVTGVFHGTRAFARHVRRRDGGGVLVNISSGAARGGYAGWSAYCASKAAVDLLTEAVQLEEQDAGLRAYSVAPGVIDTAMQETIRSCGKEQFPMVDKFHDMKRDESFSTIDHVAAELLALAFDPAHEGDPVRTSLPRP